MKLVWVENAWDDYLYWQETDKKILKRVSKLIKEASRNAFHGIGDPEALSRHDWSGSWSRRINREHRLGYKPQKDALFIAQCRYHFECY